MIKNFAYREINQRGFSNPDPWSMFQICLGCLVKVWYDNNNFCYQCSRSLVKGTSDWHFIQIIVINTLRPRQDGRHFPDDILKCIFLNENVWFPITISLKFVPKRLFNNIPALVQIMAWRRSGDKPLSAPMMVSLPMHICITRPQWVNMKSKQCPNIS